MSASGRLRQFSRRHDLRQIAVALLAYLVAAIVQLRLLVGYGIGSGSPSAQIALQAFPPFSLVAPNLTEGWILAPQSMLAGLLLPLGGSAIDVYVLQYVLLLTTEGLSFFVYARGILGRLLPTSSDRVALAAALGGLLYESQNLYNVGNLFWVANLTTYATLPFLMLGVERMTLAPSLRKATPWMVTSAFLTSYLLVVDAHSVLLIPLAFVMSATITRVTAPGSRVLRGLARAIASTAYAVALGAPSIGFLFDQHLLGSESYYYGGKTAEQISSGWANASQPLWLLLDNNWFNRNLIFSTLYSPQSGSVGLIVFLAALCSVLALSALLLSVTARQRTFNLVIGLILLATIALYGVGWPWPSPVYSLISAQTLIAHIAQEGIIPDALVSLCLSFLLAETVWYFMPSPPGKRGTRTDLSSHPDMWAGQESSRRGSAPVVRDTSRVIALELVVPPRRRVDVIPYLVVGVALIATIGQAATAYANGAGPTADGGNLLPQDPSLLGSIGPIATYVDQHVTGRVIWIPGPVYLGAGNTLIPSAYPYPEGADGPFSSEYFNYLFGPGSTSVEIQHNWAALARAAAAIGVEYVIAWGTSGLSTAQEMVDSGEFQRIIENQGATLLSNREYSGLVYATPAAAIVQGGLAAFTAATPFINTLYSNYSPIPFYTDVPPVPAIAINDTRTLYITTNFTQLELSLAVEYAGSAFQFSPFLNVSNNQPAEGWSGGDTADAGGFPWTGWVQNQPGYSWESSYGINTGYVYTSAQDKTLGFQLPTRQAGPNELLVRALASSTANSSFTLVVGGNIYPISIPASSHAHFEWLDVGSAMVTTPWTAATLTSAEGGAINLIESIPTATWNQSKSLADHVLNQSATILVPAATPDGNSSVELPIGGSYEIVPSNQPEWTTRISNSSGSVIAVKNAGTITVSAYSGSVPVLSLGPGHDLNLSPGYSNATRAGLSMSLWFRWSGTGDQTQILAADWGAGTNYSWVLSVQRPNLLVWTTGGTTWVNSVYKGIVPNVWYFVSGGFTSNTTTLYVNGTLVQTVQHYTNSTPGNHWTIGYLMQTGGDMTDNYSGEIGSVLATPQLLNQTEVTQLYVGGALGSGTASTARGFISIGHVIPIGSSNVTNAALGTPTWSADSVSDIPLALLYLVAAEHPGTVLSANSSTLWPVQLSPGQYVVSYPAGEAASVAIGRSVSMVRSAQQIALTYSTSGSPEGPMVSKVSMQVPAGDLGHPIYVSVVGNGGELIQPGSEASIGASTVQTVPAYGVTEGFVVPEAEATAHLQLSIVWFDPSPVLAENVVAYTSFIAGSCAFLISVLLPEGKYRLPKPESHLGLLRPYTFALRLARRLRSLPRRRSTGNPRH